MAEKAKTGYPSIDRTHLQGVPEELLHPGPFQPRSVLRNFLDNNDDSHMQDTAIEVADGPSYTKQQLKDFSIAAAGAVLDLGLTDSDRIAIITPNCFEGIVSMIGANAVGTELAVLDPLMNNAQLAEKLALHHPRAALVYGKTPADARSMQEMCPELEYIIDIRPQGANSGGYMSLESLLAKPIDTVGTLSEISRHEVWAQDNLFLQTSGSSSGIPKTMAFSNLQVCTSLYLIRKNTGVEVNDPSIERILNCLPYRLPYGWMTIFHNMMLGNTVMLGQPTPEAIAQYYLLEPSYIYGTPMILRIIMETAPPDADFSALKKIFCAGLPMSEEWLIRGQRFFTEHNAPDAQVLNNYGIGEGFCVGSYPDNIPHRPGTVGKLYAGVDWLIVDDDLHEVKYNEAGELLLSSDALCNGYLGNPEGTAGAFIQLNGQTFYRTGDMVSMDEDGYATIYGRGRRFFMPKGANDKVYCEAIEKALMSLKLVRQAAVVVLEDDDGHERAKAFVMPAAEVADVQAEIDSELPKFLQDFQLPSELVYIDNIPVMPSGKIDYATLEKL